MNLDVPTFIVEHGFPALMALGVALVVLWASKRQTRAPALALGLALVVVGILGETAMAVDQCPTASRTVRQEFSKNVKIATEARPDGNNHPKVLIAVTLSAPMETGGKVVNMAFRPDLCRGGGCPYVFPCPDGGKCEVRFPEVKGLSNPQRVGDTLIWRALSDVDSADAVLMFDVRYEFAARASEDEYRAWKDKFPVLWRPAVLFCS